MFGRPSTWFRVVSALFVAAACSSPDFHVASDASDGASGSGGAGAGGAPSHCENGSLDASQGETDTDCGGGCKPCAVGQGCKQGTDCESSVCTSDQCAAPACDDGVQNGDETSRDCGGRTCSGCSAGQPCVQNSDCRSSVCGSDGRCQVSCLPGSAECDGDLSKECETNVLTDPANCSACGKACELGHAVPSCIGGACQIASCKAPYDDCDAQIDNGCEINLASDAGNCGECGHVCPAINGTASCVSSMCQISCNAGFTDCDGQVENGCEKATATDSRNCGACGNVCNAPAGETAFCSDGTCGSTVCPAGFGNCDGDPSNGCEESLNDVSHCGACGSACVVANGTPGCSSGHCVVQSCDAGFSNCDTTAQDGGYADGCETNTNSSLTSCGACGAACSIANATARCETGQCRVGNCTAPFQDCDGDGKSCEINTSNNKQDCGGCGAAGLQCDTVFANATGNCVASTCGIDKCSANFDNCDGDPSNGCEADLRSSLSACGMCMHACQTTGTTGTPGNSCMAGVCTPTCSTSALDCDGNPGNGCETACASSGVMSRACSAGQCSLSCDTTHLDCDNNKGNGCETACGSAGTSSRTCSAGACSITCDATHFNCDTDLGNGCETAQSISNCGMCAQACGTAHTTGSPGTACTGGACVPSCAAGWGACGMPQSGCTVDLTTTTNCGACGNVCPAAATGTPSFCVTSGTSSACQAQITTSTSVSGSAVSPATNVTLSHALQPGSNRIVVILVAAEQNGGGTGGIAGSRPSSVSYGGTNITANRIEQSGGSRMWSPDLFIFWQPLGDATTGANQQVIVSGPTAPATLGAVAVNVIQYNGVRQTNPFGMPAAFAGGVIPTGAASNPANTFLENTVSVSVTGSRILSLTGGLTASNPTFTVTPSTGVTLTQIPAAAVVASGGGTQLTAAGLYVSGGSAVAPPPGSFTVRWTYPTSDVFTTLTAVLLPAP